MRVRTLTLFLTMRGCGGSFAHPSVLVGARPTQVLQHALAPAYNTVCSIGFEFRGGEFVAAPWRKVACAPSCTVHFCSERIYFHQ